MSTPFSFNLFTVSTHFTGPKLCAYISFFISSGEEIISAVVFATSFAVPSLKSYFSASSFNFSPAGFISDEWKGPDTARERALFAPASLSAAHAFSIADFSPAITVCFGSLKFTASTTPSTVFKTSFIFSESIPIIAAIPPFTDSAISFIVSPLNAVSFTASERVKNSPEPKAAYSPTECPATKSGFIPLLLTSFSSTRLIATIAG